MAVNERAKATVDVDGQQAEQELKKLTTRAAELRDEIIQMKQQQLVDPKKLAAAEKELKQVNTSLKSMKKQAFDVNKVLRDLNGSSFNDLVKAKRKVSAELKNMRKDAEGYQEKLKQFKKLDGQIKKHRQSLGTISSSWSKIKDTALGMFGGNLLTSGMNAVKGMFTGLISGAKEFNQANIATKRLLNETGAAADTLTQKVLTISKTFGKDYNEVLKSASVLMNNFEISGSEALELIDQGFKKGADVNGEFLMQLKEYPTFFNEAGVEASELIAIISESERMGIFSDKGVDAIKEATIRLREMTTSTRDALEGIGISSEKLEQDLRNGSISYFEAIQLVSEKLNGLEDQSPEVGAAIADIFGGAGEDAGLRYLKGLKDINTNLDEVEGQMDENQIAQLRLNEAWNSFITGIFKGDGIISRFVRGAMNALADILDQINEALKSDEQKQKERLERMTVTFKDYMNLTIKTEKQRYKNVQEMWNKDLKDKKISQEEYNKKMIALEKEHSEYMSNIRENTIKRYKGAIQVNYEENKAIAVKALKEGNVLEYQKYKERADLNKRALEGILKEEERINQLKIKNETETQAKLTEEQQKAYAKRLEQQKRDEERIRQIIRSARMKITDDEIERLNIQRKYELEQLEKLIADEQLKAEAKKAINDKFDKEIKEAEAKRAEENAQEQAEKFAEQLLKEEEMLRQQYEQKKLVLEELKLNEKLTDEEYNLQKEMLEYEHLQNILELRRTAGENIIKDEMALAWKKLDIQKLEKEERQKLNKQRLGAEKEFFKAYGELVSNMGSIIGLEGEHMANFQKALTIFQIAVDTASAISSLTKYSEANPANAATGGLAGITQFIAGLARITANIAKAKKILSSEEAPQYFAGKYPVIGADDGQLYKAELSGGSTGLYSKPTYTPGFGLYAEKGPEIVIDGPTTKNIALNYPEILSAINFARVPQYAEGTPPQTGSAEFTALLAQNIAAIQGLQGSINKGIKANIIYTEIEDSLEEVEEIKTEVSA